MHDSDKLSFALSKKRNMIRCIQFVYMLQKLTHSWCFCSICQGT